MPSHRKASGRVSLLATLGEAFGINTRQYGGKRASARQKPKMNRIRAASPNSYCSESDLTSEADIDEARPVYLGRGGKQPILTRCSHNKRSECAADITESELMDLDNSSTASDSESLSAFEVCTGRLPQKPEKTRVRKKAPSASNGDRSALQSFREEPSGSASPDLPGYLFSVDSEHHQSGHSRASIPTTDFLKTVAELERDYKQRTSTRREATGRKQRSDRPSRQV